ncbi:hypothetical protein GE061_017998 [Apolygus lucorum]|uniref:Uncharacterized protein n=1 Tax=Apolygus lucorum TaxID=248454 RepID=A0A8S9XCK3_APOLU|nr:hypothetical protein GE061_017998 [Apolygus lucorum]
MIACLVLSALLAGLVGCVAGHSPIGPSNILKAGESIMIPAASRYPELGNLDFATAEKHFGPFPSFQSSLSLIQPQYKTIPNSSTRCL